MNLKTLFKISRPRFWLYSAGTFWVGAAAASSSLSDLYNPTVLLYLVYFIIFANIFIYGINDLYDGDTDQFNQKKEDKEHRLQQKESRSLMNWVIASVIIGVALIFISPNFTTGALFAIFIFLAGSYSAEPFRFKAKPFIDAISNVHYAVIGFLAYTMIAGHLPPWWAIASAWCWTAAMHIFSAVPDIASDSQAKLKTTAVLLGAKNSMILCAVLWFVSSALLVKYFNVSPIIYLSFIYLASAIYAYFRMQNLNKFYWWFPYINAVLGLILFFLVLLN
jgi:lycopene elongase/hydratase (dihydrobisanhydrobacterioruberin-forming)